MPQTPGSIPSFPTLRSSIILALVLVVGLLIAVGVLVVVRELGQLPLAGASALACLIAALLALEPIRRASQVSVQRVAMASMIGFAIRLAVSLAGACVLIYLAHMPTRATGLWTLLWYILLLVAEVKLLAGYFTLINQQATTSSAEGQSC